MAAEGRSALAEEEERTALAAVGQRFFLIEKTKFLMENAAEKVNFAAEKEMGMELESGFENHYHARKDQKMEY